MLREAPNDGGTGEYHMKFAAQSLMLAAATLLAAAPVAAAPANPAASLSVARNARVAAPTAHGAKLSAGTSTLTFGLIGLILIGAVILIATNDTPTSV